MSLFLLEGIDDRNVESSILTLARSVDRVYNEQMLLKQSHLADLTWVSTELKAILASWGEGEIPNAMTKDRVQHLSSALVQMIEEI